MPTVDARFDWPIALAAYAVLAVAAFVVTWLVTDLAGVRRRAYIGILVAWTAALAVGYLTWSGASPSAFVTSSWAWALVAGVSAGVIAIPLVHRMRPGSRAHGGALARQLAWEGVVYGIGEGTLLAALPVVVAWNAVTDLGWTDGPSAKVSSGVLAITAAAVVVVIHHLGYREFRRAAARSKLAGAVVVCGLQSVAFLLTGNVIAPMLAHVVLHTVLVVRGVEMPPVAAGPIVELPDRRRMAHAPRVTQHDVA